MMSADDRSWPNPVRFWMGETSLRCSACVRLSSTPNGPSELPIAAVQRIRLTRWYDATRAPLVSEVNRPMKFDIQGKEGIASPTPAQISRATKSLRSYGPSSYASLTDDAGN